MLITPTAIQKWRSRGLSMLDTKDSSAEISLSQQCLKASHPSRRAKQEQIEKFQGLIDYHKDVPLYQHGMGLIDNDLFETELTEPRKKAWKKIHSAIMDLEKKINDIQRFFQNSDNILGLVRGASGFRLKKIHTLGDKDHLTTLDWALIKVDGEKRKPSNEVSNLPTLSQYLQISLVYD